MTTLKLDNETWDLTIDGQGNIAVADSSEETAQDVASACAMFLGECLYDNTLGLPYNESILGKPFSQPYFSNLLKVESRKVASVDQVVVSLVFDSKTRSIKARILSTRKDGLTQETIL